MTSAAKGPTEDEFLAHEAQVATEAIKRLKSEILENLKLAGDPRAWAEKYPLPAAGTAAASGFVAAALVKPMLFGSKQSHNGHHGPRRAAARRPKSNWQRWLRPLLNLAQSSIKSALIAGLSAKGAKEAVEENNEQPQPSEQAAYYHDAAVASGSH